MIDTWAKLQSELLDTLDRDDLVADVTAYTPGTIEGAVIRAISKAERRIVRRIRTREFETSTTIATVPGTETVAIPTDLVMFKTVVLQTNPNVVLGQKDLSTLINDTPSTATGVPGSYAPFGASLYLRPIPASVQSLKVFYYNAPTPLSAANTSNTILTKYPDLLLYGALIEVTAHVEDDGRISLWKQAFDEAVKDILNDDTMNRWSGAPITASIDIRGII